MRVQKKKKKKMDREDTRYLCEYLEHMVWNMKSQAYSSSSGSSSSMW